ncbi:hypothetical protein OIU76_004783 [Salix suchowensis]|nr:hypothetical protein OIU76_004783 [Salix suchowensis]
MFADLCYFPVRSVQLTFVFLVLPCLLLGYLGQAAYLMEHHSVDLAEQAFFSSVPSGVFWPVFLVANLAALIASRTMTTATFSSCLVLVCSISSITEIGNAYGNAYFLVRVEFFPSILISIVHQSPSLLFVSILFNDVMNVLKKKSE